MSAEERNPQLLSARLAAFVRSQGSAKVLARAIRCDVRTAENIRRGTWPNARHWSGLWDAYGERVLDAVFRADLPPPRSAKALGGRAGPLIAQRTKGSPNGRRTDVLQPVAKH